jgi:hypothetical protein
MASVPFTIEPESALGKSTQPGAGGWAELPTLRAASGRMGKTRRKPVNPAAGLITSPRLLSEVRHALWPATP